MDLSHTKLRRTSVVGGLVCCPNPPGDADESRTQDSNNPTNEEMFASKPGKHLRWIPHPLRSWQVDVCAFLLQRNSTPPRTRKKGKLGIFFNYETSRGQGSPRKGWTSVGKKNGQSGKRSLLEGLVDVRICKNYQTKDTYWWCRRRPGCTPDKRWRPGFAARLQESFVWEEAILRWLMGFERDSGVRSAETVSVETNSETALCVLGL